MEYRKKDNEWTEQKSNLEGTIKQISLKFDQSMDFINVVRIEEKNIVNQFDQKIKHYFNAAYQNLNLAQQKKAQISIDETRQLLKSIVDGVKRTVDTMDRKFESFINM